ncbi:MAG: glycosyltransferase family 25 protein [Aquabacterium sp.]|nr:glycosyltransferase family 25 protein [Ferruginibacter sp.]
MVAAVGGLILVMLHRCNASPVFYFMKDFALLNNFFDHIYVITLHRATERQAAIKTNLAGLNYQFFFGADKQQHPIEEMIQQGVYDEALAIKNHRYHKPFSAGQTCCAWSHKLVYEDVLNNGYKKVLILEDDVTAVSNNQDLLPAIIQELPANWELLYFDYSKNEKPQPIKQYWYHLQKMLGGLTWSHASIANLYPKKISEHLASAGYHDYTSAYAITAAAAEKLLQLQTPIAYLADNLLATACTTNLVNGFISRPKLFTQLSQGDDKLTHSFVDD